MNGAGSGGETQARKTVDAQQNWRDGENGTFHAKGHDVAHAKKRARVKLLRRWERSALCHESIRGSSKAILV